MRSAQRIALPVGLRVIQRSHESIGDITDIHRLEAGIWTGEWESERNHLHQTGEAVDERVPRAEDD